MLEKLWKSKIIKIFILPPPFHIKIPCFVSLILSSIYLSHQDPSFYLSIYLSIYLSLYLSIYLSIYLYIYLFNHCNRPVENDMNKFSISKTLNILNSMQTYKTLIESQNIILESCLVVYCVVQVLIISFRFIYIFKPHCTKLMGQVKQAYDRPGTVKSLAAPSKFQPSLHRIGSGQYLPHVTEAGTRVSSV